MPVQGLKSPTSNTIPIAVRIALRVAELDPRTILVIVQSLRFAMVLAAVLTLQNARVQCGTGSRATNPPLLARRDDTSRTRHDRIGMGIILQQGGNRHSTPRTATKGLGSLLFLKYTIVQL
eukprot:5038890-Pleurochrysis_carterae.AAC.2